MRMLWKQGVAWTAFFALGGIAVVRSYVAAYPTATARQSVARLVAANPAFQAINGAAHRLETVGGFAAWRFGGPFVGLAAVWGLLASTKLLRGEEEAGRTELLLAGATTRVAFLAASLVALLCVFAVTGAVIGVGLAAASVPAPGAFLIAGLIMLGAVVFALVGAVTSQLYESRRRAAGVAGVVLGLSFILRVIADGTRTLGVLRWVSPLGWLENVRPFAGTRVIAFVPVAFFAALLVGVTWWFASSRDLATGVFGANESSRDRARLLRGLGGFSFLTMRAALVSWAVGLGTFGLLYGLLAKDVVHFWRSSPGYQEFAARLGAQHLLTAEGFIGFMFTFLIVPLSFYVATHISAMRDEEASTRLDSLVVLPLSRTRWIVVRAACAGGAVGVVALVFGVLAWLGATVQGAPVGISGMIVGALNCLPVAELFLGAGVFVFAFAPRWATGATIGAVAVAYLLQLLGSLARFPAWLLDISPFHHVAPAPAVTVNATAAVMMLVIGAVLFGVGCGRFARRDLIGA